MQLINISKRTFNLPVLLTALIAVEHHEFELSAKSDKVIEKIALIIAGLPHPMYITAKDWDTLSAEITAYRSKMQSLAKGDNDGTV